MISPMQLNNYFVEEICIKENPAFDPTPNVERKIGTINCALNFAKGIDVEDHFKVQMIVSVEPAATPPALDPYQISLKIVGFFSFPPDAFQIPDLDKDKLVSLNGSSILFGLARGLVAQATGVGKYGKYLLPPINFMELWQKKQSTELPLLANQQS